MAISKADTIILWARAGGMCSKPGCNEDLTVLAEERNYTIGEMAHVIGSMPAAARGTPEGGADTYDNLILLCPTHHTHIDKASEGTYTVEMLHDWKKNHEAKITNALKAIKLENFEQLRIAISRLLIANKVTFETYGPTSEAARADPSSNAFLVWELHRIVKILPNNRKILELISTNEEFITDLVAIHAVEEFRLHVESYEKHVYQRLDTYKLFPSEFSEVFL